MTVDKTIFCFSTSCSWRRISVLCFSIAARSASSFFACSMALSGVIGVASGSLLLSLPVVALAFPAMPTMAGVADPLDTEPAEPSDS